MKLLASLRVAAGVLLLTAAGSASAVMITDQSAVTTGGQVFNYSFGGLSATSDAHVMTLFGRGDYTINAGSGAGETASWDLDGLISGLVHTINTLPANVVVTEHSLQDVSFSATFSVLGATMAALTSDGMINVTLTNSSGVNVISANSFLGFSLEPQAVPEPATLGLFGLGLAAIGFSRRRGQKS